MGLTEGRWEDQRADRTGGRSEDQRVDRTGGRSEDQKVDRTEGRWEDQKAGHSAVELVALTAVVLAGEVVV